MSIILTLLCKNEADIIHYTIDYHLALGVDLIIATDNGSTDGTRDTLSSYERQGRLVLLDEPENTHDQSVWVTRMACIAQSKYGASWLIHCDADEFWMPTSKGLKETLDDIPQDVNVVVAKRHNFLPPLEERSTNNLPFYEHQHIRYRESFNSLGDPLPGKVIHRSCPDIMIGDGNHKVFSGGKLLQNVPLKSLEVLHFPYRSYHQFHKKIVEGTEALMRNRRIGPGVGGTWRVIYSRWYKSGRLEDYYQNLIPSPQILRKRLSEGSLVYDFRLQQFFSNCKHIP